MPDLPVKYVYSKGVSERRSAPWRVSAALTARVARVTGLAISTSVWVLESATDPNEHLIGPSRRHPAPQDTQAPHLMRD